MIGTGTIDDPFIPTTLDEFRTAVSTDDAYVKLENDIDVSKDVKYRSGFTAPTNGRIFEISCKRIYADTKRAVKNLIINGAMKNFIYAYRAYSTITVENIQFLNILIRNCTDSWLYVYYYQSCTLNLINCDFSAFVLSNVCKPLLDGSHGLVCVDTSFYFVYITTSIYNNSNVYLFRPLSMTNCSIYVNCDGVRGGVASTPLHILTKATNTNLSGDFHLADSDYNVFEIMNSCTNVLCSVRFTCSDTTTATINCGGGSGINVVVTDIINGPTLGTYDSTVQLMSSDEAKDIISLQKIGFLP